MSEETGQITVVGNDVLKILKANSKKIENLEENISHIKNAFKEHSLEMKELSKKFQTHRFGLPPEREIMSSADCKNEAMLESSRIKKLDNNYKLLEKELENSQKQINILEDLIKLKNEQIHDMESELLTFKEENSEDNHAPSSDSDMSDGEEKDENYVSDEDKN